MQQLRKSSNTAGHTKALKHQIPLQGWVTTTFLKSYLFPGQRRPDGIALSIMDGT